MNATPATYFSYALMTIVARKVARLAQTDKEAAGDYFEMHAQQLNEVEKAEFKQAVVKAAIQLAA